MFSDLTVGIEAKAKQEMVESLLEAIQYERDNMNLARNEDERRQAVERLKGLSKTLNDEISTEDHAYLTDKMKLEIDKLSLELEKLEQAKIEAKKARKWDGFKTFGNWVVAGITTAIGIKTANDNLKFAKGIEDEKFLTTTAEKKALNDGLDILGGVKRLENKFGIK